MTGIVSLDGFNLDLTSINGKKNGVPRLFSLMGARMPGVLLY